MLKTLKNLSFNVMKSTLEKMPKTRVHIYYFFKGMRCTIYVDGELLIDDTMSYVPVDVLTILKNNLPDDVMMSEIEVSKLTPDKRYLLQTHFSDCPGVSKVGFPPSHSALEAYMNTPEYQQEGPSYD